MIVTYDNKADWLEARRKVLTATQASIIFNAHCGGKVWPNSTPFTVWQEKVEPEAAPVVEETIHMWMGKALEFPICEWVAEQVGAQLEYPEPYTMVIRDDAPFMACTPDAYLWYPDGRCELLEVKTASWAADWGQTGSVIVPQNYGMQVMWQQAVTGIELARLGVFLAYAIEGFNQPKVVKDLRHYPLVRIQPLEDLMVNVCRDFWDRYVETAWPPPKTYPVGGEGVSTLGGSDNGTVQQSA